MTHCSHLGFGFSNFDAEPLRKCSHSPHSHGVLHFLSHNYLSSQNSSYQYNRICCIQSTMIIIPILQFITMLSLANAYDNNNKRIENSLRRRLNTNKCQVTVSINSQYKIFFMALFLPPIYKGQRHLYCY
jgi:hypothetical protein